MINKQKQFRPFIVTEILNIQQIVVCKISSP